MNIPTTYVLLSFILLSTSYILPTPIDAQTLYENNPLTKQVLYAPSRHASYNALLEKNSSQSPETCVFCMQANEVNSEHTLLVARFTHHNLFVNLYPYQKGHLLLLPKKHVPQLNDLSDEEQKELIKILSILPDILKKLFGSAGTNIGINLGKIAGASKPEHLHVHIIPRYAAEHVSFIRAATESLSIDYDIAHVRTLLRDYFTSIQNQDVFSCE